jgi:hypothetical protein
VPVLAAVITPAERKMPSWLFSRQFCSRALRASACTYSLNSAPPIARSPFHNLSSSFIFDDQDAVGITVFKIIELVSCQPSNITNLVRLSLFASLIQNQISISCASNLAWVRTTTVGGQQYLQVVQTQLNGSLIVLRSFGPYSLESHLRAQQFAASYNQLTEIQRNPPTTDIDALIKGALVIFGAILGAAIIDEVFGQNKRRYNSRARS